MNFTISLVSTSAYAIYIIESSRDQTEYSKENVLVSLQAVQGSIVGSGSELGTQLAVNG